MCNQLSELLRADTNGVVARQSRHTADTSGPERLFQHPEERPRGAAGRSLLLAPREIETLELVVGGLTHAQAARKLGVAETTVNGYIARIGAKLNVGNKAELTRTAIALGLVRWHAPIDIDW